MHKPDIRNVTHPADQDLIQLGLPLPFERTYEENLKRLRRLQFESRFPQPPHYAQQYARLRNRLLITSAGLGTVIGTAAYFIAR